MSWMTGLGVAAVLGAAVLTACGDAGPPDVPPAPASAEATPTPAVPVTASATATPTETASGWLDEPVHVTLMVISNGAPDALTLEWCGSPAGVTSWQYRLFGHTGGHLFSGAWADVPGSSANTRRYRVTGLSPDTPYEAEVRPVMGTSYGAASTPTLADRFPHTSGNFTAPEVNQPNIGRQQVVEGDGLTRWRVYGLRWGVIVPDGFRVVLLPPPVGEHTVGLKSVDTGSSVLFDSNGEVLHRNYSLDAAATPCSNPDTYQDQHTLLDEMADSVVVLQ